MRRKPDYEMPLLLLVLCLQLAQLIQDKKNFNAIKEKADDYTKTFRKRTKMRVTKEYLECLMEDVVSALDYIDSLTNGKDEA